MGKIVKLDIWRERDEPCDKYPYWVDETRHYAASCETCHHPKCRQAGFHYLACIAHTSNPKRGEVE